jgi:hypothetical protein
MGVDVFSFPEWRWNAVKEAGKKWIRSAYHSRVYQICSLLPRLTIALFFNSTAQSCNTANWIRANIKQFANMWLLHTCSQFLIKLTYHSVAANFILLLKLIYMQLFVVHAWACVRRVYLYRISDFTELRSCSICSVIRPNTVFAHLAKELYLIGK